MKSDELKKLPLIPLTGARTFKKKMFTDLGPRNNFDPLDEGDENDLDSVDDKSMSIINKKRIGSINQKNNLTLD